MLADAKMLMRRARAIYDAMSARRVLMPATLIWFDAPLCSAQRVMTPR